MTMISKPNRLLPMLLASFSLIAMLLGAATSARAGETLDAIRQAGTVVCGAVTDVDDYSEADTHGNLSALGADFCRAVAAEIFGDPSKARFITSSDEPGGLAAVRDKKTSVLFGATPDPVIGAAYGLAYGPPIFFDGQGFLVAKDAGINHIADLSKRHVCFINASPAERYVYSALEPKLSEREERFPYSERGEMDVALLTGHCDAITGDISWMANVRLSFRGDAVRFVVLPDTITIDPFSPAFRTDDPEWAALIDWTVWALLQAEEHGLSKANLDAMRESSDPVIQRLLGKPWIARSFGLSDDAFAHAIQAVGNYGEIYERDVGNKLNLPRGRNASAAQGGLMWALPIEPLQ